MRINTTPNLVPVQDPAVLDGALIPRTSVQPHPQGFSVGLQTDDNWTLLIVQALSAGGLQLYELDVYRLSCVNPLDWANKTF